LNYKQFGDFYEVKSTGTAQITLNEPLEADINQDTKWYAFNKLHPANWFGYPLYLEPGMNKVIIKPVGDNQVTGTIGMQEPKLFDVVLDIYPPEVIKSTPRPGSTNLHYSNLTFEIREVAAGDFGALLDIDSLVLTVTSGIQTETYAVDQGCTITTEQSGPVYNYLLACDRGSEFEIGEYQVLLTGQDKAGNELQEDGGYINYTFTINDGFPNAPKWTFDPAYFHEPGNKWFTNQIPDFTLDFTDNDVEVVLERLFKLQLGEGGSGSQVPHYYCDATSFNYYECYFTFNDDTLNTNKLLMNQAYDIIIESYLDFPEGDGPLARFHSELLVLDDIAPDVTGLHFKNPIAQNKNLSFELTIPNELFELNVTMLYYGDGNTYTLDEINNNKFGDYVFYWTVPFYNKAVWPHLENPQQILLTVKDYAGNAPATKSDNLVIDLTPPDFNTFTFTPLVPYEEPDQVPPKYYTNNCTVDIVGSFTDDDIDNIVIAPGTWLEWTEAHDIIGQAHVNLDQTYGIQVKLEGGMNESIPTNFTLYIEDEAGNLVAKDFELYCDLKPPQLVDIEVS